MIVKITLLLVSFCTALLSPSFVFSVDVAPRITDREIVERLTRFEEGQKALAQRIDDTNRRIDDVNRRLDEGFKALSQRIEDGDKALNQRIDDTNRRIDELKQDLGQRIDELRETLLWSFGVLFTGMLTLVGFVLWDRRSALAPAVRQMDGLREREERLEAALKEYASTAPELAEVLRKLGLL